MENWFIASASDYKLILWTITVKFQYEKNSNSEFNREEKDHWGTNCTNRV